MGEASHKWKENLIQSKYLVQLVKIILPFMMEKM